MAIPENLRLVDCLTIPGIGQTGENPVKLALEADSTKDRLHYRKCPQGDTTCYDVFVTAKEGKATWALTETYRGGKKEFGGLDLCFPEMIKVNNPLSREGEEESKNYTLTTMVWEGVVLCLDFHQPPKEVPLYFQTPLCRVEYVTAK